MSALDRHIFFIISSCFVVALRRLLDTNDVGSKLSPRNGRQTALSMFSS